MTRQVIAGAGALALLASIGTTAWGFECPARIKEAREAIAAAEPSVKQLSDPRAKGNAEGMLEAARDMIKEAQEYHDRAVANNSAADHYEAAAWAKAAKWLADQARGGR